MSITQLSPERTAETPKRRFLLGIKLATDVVDRVTHLEEVKADSLTAEEEFRKLSPEDLARYDAMMRLYIRGDRSPQVMDAIRAVDPIIVRKNSFADVSSAVRSDGARVTSELAGVLPNLDGFVNIGDRSYQFDPYADRPLIITSDPRDNTVVYLGEDRTVPGEGRIGTAEDYALLIGGIATIQQSA